MNRFTPCLPAVASTEDASNGYRGQSVTTSWSSWRFPFDFLFWDWHASHYIEVSSFFSNRLDCHYLKRLVLSPSHPTPPWFVLLKFLTSQHLLSLPLLILLDSLIPAVYISVMVPYFVAMLKVIWISCSLLNSSICYMLCPLRTYSFKIMWIVLVQATNPSEKRYISMWVEALENVLLNAQIPFLVKQCKSRHLHKHKPCYTS